MHSRRAVLGMAVGTAVASILPVPAHVSAAPETAKKTFRYIRTIELPPCKWQPLNAGRTPAHVMRTRRVEV